MNSFLQNVGFLIEWEIKQRAKKAYPEYYDGNAREAFIENAEREFAEKLLELLDKK